MYVQHVMSYYQAEIKLCFSKLPKYHVEYYCSLSHFVCLLLEETFMNDCYFLFYSQSFNGL